MDLGVLEGLFKGRFFWFVILTPLRFPLMLGQVDVMLYLLLFTPLRTKKMHSFYRQSKKNTSRMSRYLFSEFS